MEKYTKNSINPLSLENHSRTPDYVAPPVATVITVDSSQFDRFHAPSRI